jgi:hypothetical protein
MLYIPYNAPDIVLTLDIWIIINKSPTSPTELGRPTRLHEGLEFVTNQEANKLFSQRFGDPEVPIL